MQKTLPLVAVVAAAPLFITNASAITIWEVDFEGTDDIQGGNTASIAVVDVASTPAINGQGGFAGNAGLVSFGTNPFNSVRSVSENAISPVDITVFSTYNLTFDLFINTNLPNVPNFQPRLEANGAPGNGSAITLGVDDTTLGFVSVSVTGDIADVVNGDGPYDTTRPFLAFFGSGSAIDDVLYIDNIKFELVPEPASVALLGLGGLLIGRRRRA